MATTFILLGVLMIFFCGASATLLTQRDTTPPQIERTVPDLSEKVAPELKAIRIVFSEKMQGMDVGFYGVPVGTFDGQMTTRPSLFRFGNPYRLQKFTALY